MNLHEVIDALNNISNRFEIVRVRLSVLDSSHDVEDKAESDGGVLGDISVLIEKIYANLNSVEYRLDTLLGAQSKEEVAKGR